MSAHLRPAHAFRSALSLALLALSATAAAAEFTVNSIADAPDMNPGDGQCAAFGLPPSSRCTLRAAIMEGNEQPGTTTIHLPPLEYRLDEAGAAENSSVTGDFDIFGDIQIINTSTEELAVITQDTLDRVFDVYNGGRLLIRGIAVFGGNVTQDPIARLGGGARVWPNGSLQMESSFFYGPSAEEGGGIYGMGQVTLIDSEIAFAILRSEAPTENSQGVAISMVNAGQGAASLTMLRSSLTANGVEDIVVAPGIPVLADRYALMSRDGAKVQLVNSSIITNARGIWSRPGSQLQLLQTTIAGHEGTGLRFDHDPDNPAVQLSIAQTAIVQNGGVSECRAAGAFFLNPNLSQLQIRNLYNASSDASCGFDGATDVAITGQPLYKNRTFNQGPTYWLPTPGGGLVDTGGPACITSEDQQGRPRPVQGSALGEAHCDIGAVELTPALDPPQPAMMFTNGFED